ncbi:MAG: prepilin peptidase [Methanobacteriota archaeon]
MIEILKVFLTFPILAYASFLDWKHREIDDKSWLLLAALGILFLLYNFEIKNFLISVVATAIFSLALYYLGLIGGGDAKILVGIGALFPVYPSAITLFPIFAISVFANAVLLSALLPIFFFTRNLKHLKEIRSVRDFFVLFLGYKKDASQIKSYEAVVDSIFLNVSKVRLGKKNGRGEVWVTPALPFLIPITIGFLIAAFFGDLASFIIMALIK